MTVVVDSCGASDLTPWLLSSVSFLGDYHNFRLMMQDPNGDLAAAWATEYKQTPEGVSLKLNPKATFAAGSPADAQALKIHIEGFMGKVENGLIMPYIDPVCMARTVAIHDRSPRVKRQDESPLTKLKRRSRRQFGGINQNVGFG